MKKDKYNLLGMEFSDIKELTNFVSASTNKNSLKIVQALCTLSGEHKDELLGAMSFTEKKEWENILWEEEKTLEPEMLTEFKALTLTSKEADFNKFNTLELEIIGGGRLAKTKDTIIAHSIEYNTTRNGKTVRVKKDGQIITSFQSPLDWLDKTYNLAVKDATSTLEIIQKIQATKHFEIKSRQEEVYNAICAILKQKSQEDGKTLDIFVSFAELHRQMGYKRKVRQTDMEAYEYLIDSLSYLKINVDMQQSPYANHIQFYKMWGSIKDEPLIVFKGFSQMRLKVNKTCKKVLGFRTDLTSLMKLHFNYTKQFFSSSVMELEKSRPTHAYKLQSYVRKLYFINAQKSNTFIEIGLDRLFGELKEFEMEKAYKEEREKSKFLYRKITKIIEKMPEIEKCEQKDAKIAIYFKGICTKDKKE